MTDKQQPKTTFDATFCRAMMEKMMSRFEEGGDCSKMMAQMKGQGGAGCCAAPGEMFQTMAMCCGAPGKTEKENIR